MATQLQLRQGTAAQNAAFTGAQGEVVYLTDTDQFAVHDGVTPGGTIYNPSDWGHAGGDEPSNASSSDFTNLSVYKGLKVVFSIRPAAQADLLLRVGSDNGSTYDAGTNHYEYYGTGYKENGSAYTHSSQSSTKLLLASSVQSSGSARANGVIYILSFAEAKKSIVSGHITFEGVSGYMTTAVIGGQRDSAVAHDAFRLFFDGQNIAEGWVNVEGLRL